MILFELKDNGNLEILIDNNLRNEISNEFAKLVVQKIDPMTTWYNNKDVPQSEKDKYKPIIDNTTKSMDLIYHLMKHCGFTDDDIKNLAKLPF